MPAVLLLLASCLTGMQLAGQHLRLQDAAATAARSLARGDRPPLAALAPGATLDRSDDAGLVCARLRVPAAIAGGVLGSITLTASSCAAGGGR